MTRKHSTTDGQMSAHSYMQTYEFEEVLLFKFNTTYRLYSETSLKQIARKKKRKVHFNIESFDFLKLILIELNSKPKSIIINLIKSRLY